VAFGYLAKKLHLIAFKDQGGCYRYWVEF